MEKLEAASDKSTDEVMRTVGYGLSLTLFALSEISDGVDDLRRRVGDDEDL